MREEYRTECETNVVENPWTGHRIVIDVTETTHYVEGEALRSHTTRIQGARRCACLKPPAGFCAECDMLSCVDCYGRCAECAKPLCSKCGRTQKSRSGETIRLCSECYGDAARKRLLRGLLKPFVEFQE